MLMETLTPVPGVTFTSGLGASLFDTEGNSWLDFFADVGTASLGYNPAEWRHAMGRMLQRGIPVHAPNLFRFAERDRAAGRLCKATGMESVFFCNSGTEAVEAAIKLVRLRHHRAGTGKSAIVGLTGAFHGRTYASLAAGDGPPHHYEGFGHLPIDFMHVSDFHAIPSDAAAVIMAPVFGNNDVREYDMRALHWLRHWTSDNGIALIFDEVQTGAGRSGAAAYGMANGVLPDVLCLAKGIATGAPVGACLATGSYVQAFTPGSHFSTFGGNPFSCVMVNTMLDWLETPGNLSDVFRKGAWIKAELTELGVREPRGPGMLIAFDYLGNCLELAAAAREERLLIGAFRAGPGPIKITPPLNISEAELGEGLSRLGKALKRCS